MSFNIPLLKSNSEFSCAEPCMRGKNWLEVLKMCAKTQEVLKLAKKISCNYPRHFCTFKDVSYLKKIPKHHSTAG